MDWRTGNVGCPFESGRIIRITRRTFAKNRVIRLYYCEVQYLGCLKTERYDVVQVVLLISLTLSYHGLSYEDERRYGGGDISGGSSIFACSKDGWVGDGPLPSLSTNHYFWIVYQKYKINKEKCPSVGRERWLLSRELFTASEGPKPNLNFTKVL